MVTEVTQSLSGFQESNLSGSINDLKSTPLSQSQLCNTSESWSLSHSPNDPPTTKSHSTHDFCQPPGQIHCQLHCLEMSAASAWFGCLFNSHSPLNVSLAHIHLKGSFTPTWRQRWCILDKLHAGGTSFWPMETQSLDSFRDHSDEQLYILHPLLPASNSLSLSILW